MHEISNEIYFKLLDTQNFKIGDLKDETLDQFLETMTEGSVLLHTLVDSYWLCTVIWVGETTITVMMNKDERIAIKSLF